MIGRFVLCRWRVNDMFEPTRYCGKAIAKDAPPKKPYCEYHWKRLPAWPQSGVEK